MKEYGRQFVTFATIGVINTLVDLLLYLSLTVLVPFFSPASTGALSSAKALSFLGATFGSYLLNRRFTFGRRNSAPVREILRFYAAIGSGIFINVAAHRFFLSAGWHGALAALPAALATALWGFTLSRRFVFRT
jgi:putative flippase GtrA